MATIEERAREYSLKDFDGYYAGWEKDVEEGYIAGATEQKALDIENAKNAFNKTCGWLSTYPSCESWYNELFENFMKNMEEKL